MSYRAIILTMKLTHNDVRNPGRDTTAQFQTRVFRDDDELDGLRAIKELLPMMKKQGYALSDVANYRGIEVSQ